MVSKEEKNRRRKLVAAIEDKQLAQEISNMPISAADLKALFEFLDRPEPHHCDHSLKETIEFLDEHNLDTNKIIPWLNEYGGYCDCEVIFNVADAWGEYVGLTFCDDDFPKPASKEKKQKQETLSLTCGLKLPNIPKGWKLFFVDAAKNSYWQMDFGRKGILSLKIFETPLPKGDHQSAEYWVDQWIKLTNLPLNAPCIVENEQQFLANATLISVTVRHPGWLPVYRWIYNPENLNWYMQAETDSIRKQGDFLELSNLLREFLLNPIE